MSQDQCNKNEMDGVKDASNRVKNSPVWRMPSSCSSAKKTSQTDNLSNPVHLDRIHSTNFLLKNDSGSSAIVVLPAAEANWLSRNHTMRTASSSTITSFSSSQIPAITTVASFDEDMISITQENTWSFGKILERFTRGLC
jgi:hypothetical protein